MDSPTAKSSDRRTLVETAVRQAPFVTAALLVVVPLASWAWIALMARDMYGAMDGAAAWMMTDDWDLPHLVLLWAMWAVMMTAMMLPSASPLILLYAGTVRTRSEGTAGRLMYALAAGYLCVWAAFSIVATLLQRALTGVLALTPMMEPASPKIAAAILAVAAVYQLTPQKAACLRVCRSPLAYLLQHWRAGASGAFALGARHGAYCVGCCFALMLLLFAGGVMNLVVIVALALWVAVEKLAPFGTHTPKVSALALLALAAWLALR